MKNRPSSNNNGILAKTMAAAICMAIPAIAVPKSAVADYVQMEYWSHEKQEKALILVNEILLLDNEIKQGVELWYPGKPEKWHPGLKARKSYKSLTTEQIEAKKREKKQKWNQLRVLIGSEGEFIISDTTRRTLADLLGNTQVFYESQSALGDIAVKRTKKDDIKLEHVKDEDDPSTGILSDAGITESEKIPEQFKDPSFPKELIAIGVVAKTDENGQKVVSFPYTYNGQNFDVEYGETTAQYFDWNGTQVLDIRIDSPKPQHYVFHPESGTLYYYEGEDFKWQIVLTPK